MFKTTKQQKEVNELTGKIYNKLNMGHGYIRADFNTDGKLIAITQTIARTKVRGVYDQPLVSKTIFGYNEFITDSEYKESKYYASSKKGVTMNEYDIQKLATYNQDINSLSEMLLSRGFEYIGYVSVNKPYTLIDVYMFEIDIQSEALVYNVNNFLDEYLNEKHRTNGPLETLYWNAKLLNESNHDLEFLVNQLNKNDVSRIKSSQATSSRVNRIFAALGSSVSKARIAYIQLDVLDLQYMQGEFYPTIESMVNYKINGMVSNMVGITFSSTIVQDVMFDLINGNKKVGK